MLAAAEDRSWTTASQRRNGDGPLTLRVERERADLSRYYDDQLWVKGWRLDDAGVPVEALVPVALVVQQVEGYSQNYDGRA